MSQITEKARLSLGHAASYLLLQRVPFIRKAAWRALYNVTHKTVTADDFVFMNLGYASCNDAELPDKISVTRLSQQLYERVISNVQLTNSDVLEIGCGRGGGAAHVYATYAPKSLVGMDLSPLGIQRCKAQHERAGLRFVEGDAMKLPFTDASFDGVLNVESSHCYPSRAKFFAEVKRVLKPGGHFMFTDIFWSHLESVSISDVVQMLNKSGLQMIEEENITKNVVRARSLLDADPEYGQTLERWTPPAGKVDPKMDNMRREVSALPGTFHYNALEEGKGSYWRWVLRKPYPS